MTVKEHSVFYNNHECYVKIDNPKEKEFHDKFVEMFSRDSTAHNMLSNIIFGSDEKGRPIRYTNPKESTICVNLIQWLGSPVGQSFLNECGFYEN